MSVSDFHVELKSWPLSVNRASNDKPHHLLAMHLSQYLATEMNETKMSEYFLSNRHEVDPSLRFRQKQQRKASQRKP
jgi:hypothetical protein